MNVVWLASGLMSKHEQARARAFASTRSEIMELLKWKLNMAVLWLIQMVNFAALIFLGLLFAQKMNERTGFDMTRFLFFSCLMAWLSVILKGSASRWISFIFGIPLALLKLYALIKGLPPEAGVRIAFCFNELWGLLGALLIVWYAWKMPKQEAQVLK
jgi:hypothetical protein